MTSAFFVETRPTSGSESRVRQLEYLDDAGRSRGCRCINSAGDPVFEQNMAAICSMRKDDVRDTELVTHAQYLLVNVNHKDKRVRREADKCLTSLVDRFPHLLWHCHVLWTMLDVLNVLCYSLHVFPNDENPTTRINRSPYSIAFVDSLEARETVVKDFASRCQGIVQEAMTRAPQMTQSHLQEYLQHVSTSPRYRHARLALAIKSVEPFTFLTTLAAPLQSVRGRYAGEAAGQAAAKLVEDVRHACKTGDCAEHRGTLYRATALLIAFPAVNQSLLNVIASSQVQLFKEEAAMTAVDCWLWLLSSRPDLEMALLKELLSAWQSMVDKKLGLFAAEEVEASPLAVIDNVKLEPNAPLVRPQFIWLGFMLEVADTVKHGSVEKAELLATQMMRVLCETVGARDPKQNRHAAAVGARFRLLSCCLSLLQGDVLQESTSTELRLRVYNTSLDYFCCARSFPTQRDAHLRDDVTALVRFWQMLSGDKKYVTAGVQGEIDPDKKRNLILDILAVEIEFLCIWCNPLHHGDMEAPGEAEVSEWRCRKVTEQTLAEQARLAWRISPTLAVFLPIRLNNSESVVSEVSREVRAHPAAVSHIPHALRYLVTLDALRSNARELAAMMTWAPVSPIEALAYFSSDYTAFPITGENAVRVLKSHPAEALMFYIPQMVQAIRHDTTEGDLFRFVEETAAKSQVFGHQIIWNLHANMDDAMRAQHPQLHNKLDALAKNIEGSLSGTAKQFYDREFEFVNNVINISGEIRRKPKGDERKRACLEALSKVEMLPGCYLPSSPEAMVTDINRESGRPMQSAAKAPYRASFPAKLCCIQDMEKMDEAKSKSTQHLNDSTVEAIFKTSMALLQLNEDLDHDRVLSENSGEEAKQDCQVTIEVGDDVRQDMLALQIIAVCKNIFQKVGLDLYLFPYRVVATAPGCGVIQCVPDAVSRDQLGKEHGAGLYDYFVATYGAESTAKFQRAQGNFVRSMAAYSVVSFLLQFKDRHNGNIMFDKEGHIIHIDFGFMLGSSPAKNIGFEPNLKLTKEMIQIMGGHKHAAPFMLFLQLCVQAYLAARSYRESIVSLVSLMLETDFECFRGRTLESLRLRFRADSSEKEAAEYILKVIRKSYRNARTVLYDQIQKHQNQIHC